MAHPIPRPNFLCRTTQGDTFGGFGNKGLGLNQGGINAASSSKLPIRATRDLAKEVETIRLDQIEVKSYVGVALRATEVGNMASRIEALEDVFKKRPEKRAA